MYVHTYEYVYVCICIDTYMSTYMYIEIQVSGLGIQVFKGTVWDPLGGVRAAGGRRARDRVGRPEHAVERLSSREVVRFRKQGLGFMG